MNRPIVFLSKQTSVMCESQFYSLKGGHGNPLNLYVINPNKGKFKSMNCESSPLLAEKIKRK